MELTILSHGGARENGFPCTLACHVREEVGPTLASTGEIDAPGLCSRIPVTWPDGKGNTGLLPKAFDKDVSAVRGEAPEDHSDVNPKALRGHVPRLVLFDLGGVLVKLRPVRQAFPLDRLLGSNAASPRGSRMS